MKVDNCYQLGEVTKTHGLKGEVIIHLDTDDPDKYNELESMFLLMAGKLVPFFIESSQVQGTSTRVKIEDVDDLEAATRLIGMQVYLPLTWLDETDGYYYHELIGFDVLLDKRTIGQLTEIYDQEINPLFAFNCDGQEVLVPFQDHFVLAVDKKARQIVINLPEGYLDIYLNP